MLTSTLSTCFEQGLKKGLVVAKKLIVHDFWLVVNGDLAIEVRLNNKLHHRQKRIKSKITYMCCACLQGFD